MVSAAIDCLCVGIIVSDHVCEPIERLPAAGELVLTERMYLTIGGCASNVAVDLAKLNHAVSVVGRVGDDTFGRFVCESLTTANVDVEHIARSTTAETSGTLIVNVKGEDRRFIHSAGANSEFTVSDISDELIRSSKVLYLGGYLLVDSITADDTANLFQRAQSLGVTTVLDVVIPGAGNHWDRLLPVLAYTDYFCPNDDEAKIITGLDDPLQQATQFRQAGANVVVITQGDQGSLLLANDTMLQAGRHETTFVDGTGSGDAFVAGFISGLLAEKNMADCLRYGSALGASCVQAAGATTGVFDQSALEQFLANNPLQIEQRPF